MLSRYSWFCSKLICWDIIHYGKELNLTNLVKVGFFKFRKNFFRRACLSVLRNRLCEFQFMGKLNNALILLYIYFSIKTIIVGSEEKSIKCNIFSERLWKIILGLLNKLLRLSFLLQLHLIWWLQFIFLLCILSYLPIDISSTEHIYVIIGYNHK